MSTVNVTVSRQRAARAHYSLKSTIIHLANVLPSPLALAIFSTSDSAGKADSDFSYRSQLLNSLSYVNVATTCLLCSAESIRSGEEGEGGVSCGPDNIDMEEYKPERRLMHRARVSVSHRIRFSCLSLALYVLSSHVMALKYRYLRFHLLFSRSFTQFEPYEL